MSEALTVRLACHDGFYGACEGKADPNLIKETQTPLTLVDARGKIFTSFTTPISAIFVERIITYPVSSFPELYEIRVISSPLNQGPLPSFHFHFP